MTANHPAELSHEQLQKVMSTVDIPTCPASVTQAMSEAQKDDPDLRRLADLIASDPAMSAAALKLANSPLYRGNREITGVRQAVDRLGTKNVVCIVVGIALRASVSGLPAQWLESFWRRNTQLALAASIVARAQFGISRDTAYTYTLFHDAAIPVMMKRFPDYPQLLDEALSKGLSTADAEAGFFPCTHPIVGSLLVRNWGLPAVLGQAIRCHHDLEAYDLPERTLPTEALTYIAVTHITEHLAAEIRGEPDHDVGPVLFERARQHLGLSLDELDELRQTILPCFEDQA